jgi:hypothetical protein
MPVPRRARGVTEGSRLLGIAGRIPVNSCTNAECSCDQHPCSVCKLAFILLLLRAAVTGEL